MSCDKDERHGVKKHVGLFQERYNGTYTQARGHKLTERHKALTRHYIKVVMNINEVAVGLEERPWP